MPNRVDHECDLFLFSSCSTYNIRQSLETFAKHGTRNKDGWGIGYYSSNKAKVVRSEKSAFDDKKQLTNEFKLACEMVESPLILGHLRRTSRGENIVENNQPFKMNFLGYEWLFMHNGTSRNTELVSEDKRILTESKNDSPRVFEFLRYEIINYISINYKRSLVNAIRYAFKKLLELDKKGTLNIVLTNGSLTFVLAHWRDFYLFESEKEMGNIIKLSTINVDISHAIDSNKRKFKKLSNKKAKFLVFSGHSLIINGDI